MIFKLWIFSIFMLIIQPAIALEINQQRADFNYKMFCRGCHTPDAMGRGDVPRINNYIGHFLRIEGGREYLVQVPGSANAALNDEQLTELLNWVIRKFGGDSVPSDFKPYQINEVAELRKNPLYEVVDTRKKLVEQIEHQRTLAN